jgi:hypothetical protein
VTLDTIFQQDGKSNEPKCFLHLLMNVRDTMPSIEEWKLLINHTNTSLDASKKESFYKEIHLFATNDDVQN